MKLIDAEKLKAEIERLKAKYREDMYKSNYEGLASGYKIEAYNELLLSLDSLQQEQPKVDLEEEFRRFIKKEKEGEPDGSLPFYGDYGIYRIARHFYELGKNSK